VVAEAEAATATAARSAVVATGVVAAAVAARRNPGARNSRVLTLLLLRSLPAATTRRNDKPIKQKYVILNL
jgi:hypothetical protein